MCHYKMRLPTFISIFRNQNMPLSVVWRDQADPEAYEQARTSRLFNYQRPERYPLAIVFAKTESDIISAGKLAREKKSHISIRAGGHSWPAWSVRDNAILLDLGGYSELVLDERTGIVRVSPSTTGEDLANYLLTKGRVLSVGHCPDVGVGGFLLCGGMGWNCNVSLAPHDPDQTNKRKELGLCMRAGRGCGCSDRQRRTCSSRCPTKQRSLLGCERSWAGFPRCCYAISYPNQARPDIYAVLGVYLSHESLQNGV